MINKQKMKNYKNSSNDATTGSAHYNSYFEKRKELRKKAKLSSPIWSSPSTSEDERPENLFKSFFKSNLYFKEEPIKKIIPSNTNNTAKQSMKPREPEKQEEKKPISHNESDDDNESYDSKKLEHVDKSAMITTNQDELENLLGKKTFREDQRDWSDNNANLSTIGLQDQESNSTIKPKQLEIKFNEREIKKIMQGAKIDKRELELFAPYVQKGKRIPRRGEVGLTSEAIENFEKLGYVMSGSRHKKMTSAREMKEKQIFTVEEKKALAIFNLEEQQRKEINIINNFKKILLDKKGTEKDEEGFYIDKSQNQN